MTAIKSSFFVVSFLILLFEVSNAQIKIDRKALVQRHNVIVTKADSLSSLSVGNGKFAFTVDVTGLQTFPITYKGGVPLGTQSEWGWHSFPNTAGFRREEALKDYSSNGRKIPYLVQSHPPGRAKDASEWFRQNPHRLQLGNLGFEIRKKDGSLININDVKDIRQELNLWTGEIKSQFTIEGILVNVSTFCNQSEDLISASIKSDLLKTGQLKISLRFPYPTGNWTDEGTNYVNENKHLSYLKNSTPYIARIVHELDSTKYFVQFAYQGAVVKKQEDHYYLIEPFMPSENFWFSCKFAKLESSTPISTYQQTKASNVNAWLQFWNKTGVVDFSGSIDKRASELERRIILSQYLIKIQETGSSIPQETGLTYNSWYGKPHSEMPYWHLGHYPYWEQSSLLEKTMQWYFTASGKAKAIAKRQGFDGVRWPKMTDNTGDETPSSVGALLIWDQPHLIYFAESIYRQTKNKATLNKYKDLVFATADFMASFAYYEKNKDRYILGKGLIPAQEVFPAEETFNPTYELVYWDWALNIAQQWRERLQMPRNKNWDEVLEKLSALPVQNNLYLPTESATDSYTNPKYKTDHPAVLMAYGVMPQTGLVDENIMRNTFNWIWNNWTWDDTWGWDFPMVAMAATRLGMPEKAVDALLMNVRTNTYLVSGHNYQDGRLRIYLPGNGALLNAIALMCAGYDGSEGSNPGFPKNGQWKVRWEGIRRLP